MVKVRTIIETSKKTSEHIIVNKARTGYSCVERRTIDLHNTLMMHVSAAEAHRGHVPLMIHNRLSSENSI